MLGADPNKRTHVWRRSPLADMFSHLDAAARQVLCAAAEQTDEGTFRRTNTGIIVILYRSSVASWTNSLIQCRAVRRVQGGEEM